MRQGPTSRDSQSGMSLIGAMVVVAVIGTMAAAMFQRRNNEAQLLSRETMSEHVERAMQTSLMMVDDLINSGSGCYGGYTSRCSPLFIRPVCQGEAPVGGWSSYARNWWAWANTQGFTRKWATIVRNGDRSSAWKATEVPNGLEIEAAIPNLSAMNSREDFETIFGKGALPTKASKARQVEECIATVLSQFGPPSEMFRSLDDCQKLSEGRTIDQDDFPRIRVGISLSTPECRKGRTSSIMVEAAPKALGKEFGKHAGQAFSRTQKARLQVTESYAPVSCVILGPTAGDEGDRIRLSVATVLQAAS